jgi:LuxR family maltose regulon positive regulatory protein
MVPRRRIPRARLEAHGGTLCDFALTAVSAGAGYGKTTLLRAWAERCARDADTAWLALDDGAADVRAFAAGLDAALRRALGDLGRSVPALLDDRCAEPSAFARAIADELLGATEERERDVVLFLDDFQEVQAHPGVRELVSRLLRALPPRAHLVVASRLPLEFSPIVKLRAEGHVADLTQNELRFTSEEARALLESAGLETVEAEALDALVQRADGWAMALRLSAQAAPALGAKPSRLAAAALRPLFAYLADEVLHAQPPEVRARLLDCAVPRTLDARTLERVLDLPDGRAQIETFLARNLYLEPDGTDTYRFQHLFREFLLETLAREAPDRLREVRIRYARALEERGDGMGAVAQYLEAGDFLSVINHVAQVQFAIKYGEDAERIAVLLRQIPDELKCRHPRLLQFEATAKRRLLDLKGAAATFARARARALELEDFATACVCTLEEGMLADDLRAGGHGTFEASVQLFSEALRYAERCGPKAPIYVKLASLALGLAYAAQFEYERAKPLLARAEALQRASATRSDVITTIAIIHGWQGEWQRALEYAELSEDFLRTSGGDQLIGRALKVQAKAHCYLRDDVRRALTIAEKAIEAERSSNGLDDLPDAYVVLAQAHLAQPIPAVEGALNALDEAEARLRRRPNRITSFDVRAARTETHLVTGALTEARRELTAARALAEANRDPHETALTEFLEGLLRIASAEHAEAAERFAAAGASFETLHDSFYARLCDIAGLAARARVGALDAETFVKVLERIECPGGATALRSAPRSAALVLSWALRTGVAAERASRVLGDAAQEACGDLIVLAGDERAPSAARARAVALLARELSDERRATLTKLLRARDPAVAAAAATALRLFPRSVAPPLSLHVVGPLRVRIGDETLEERDGRWTRKKALEMLRALALAESPLAKGTLLADLWPDRAPAVAETSLRVTLHALRRALEPEIEGTGHYVDYDGTTLTLRKDSVAFVDAHEAQRAFRRACLARARDSVAEAEALFARTIELLRDAPCEEHVSEWLAPHAGSWRRTLGAALRSSAELRLRAGNVAAAQALVERALAVDPLDEESVSLALDVAVAARDLELAKSTFIAYRKRLAAELSAAPGPELIARYGAVLKRRSAQRVAELTERELQILALIGRGRSNKQMAAELSLSPWTISSHVAHILRKLRVESRAAAVAVAGGFLEA